jgi:hypothetical protein
MPRVFTSAPVPVGKSALSFPPMELLDIPLLLGCSLDYAHANGGDIIRSVVMDLPGEWSRDDTVVSVKVHHLVDTYYPAPMGWHCDVHLTGNPVTEDDLQIRHMNVWFGNDVSRTEYIEGRVVIPDYVFDMRGWAYWQAIDKLAEAAVGAGEVRIVSAVHGEYIENRAGTLHRATPAKGTGIRLFMKFNKGPGIRPRNRIGKFSQVYIPS